MRGIDLKSTMVVEGGQSALSELKVAIADVVEDIGRRGAILMGGLIELECEAIGLRVPGCLGLQEHVSLWFRMRRGLDVADDKRGQEDKCRGVFD